MLIDSKGNSIFSDNNHELQHNRHIKTMITKQSELLGVLGFIGLNNDKQLE